MFFSTFFSSPIRQLDVRNAFLYGVLDRNIYLELPAGHPRRDMGRNVWTTRRALYGLCESPRVWNDTIQTFFLRYGLRNLTTERCLYILPQGGTDPPTPFTLILVLYVDDVLFCGQSDVVQKFMKAIKQKFQIKTKEIAEEFMA